MKKRTILTILFAVVAAAAIAAGFFFFAKREKQAKQNSEPAYDLIDEAYWTAAEQCGETLYGTDIEDLFYTSEPVRYFYAQNGTLEELEPETSLSLYPVVGGCEIELEIPLVSIGNRQFGVGVWHADEGIYQDVFAVLRDMPEGFASPYPYLLLLDTHNTQAGADERLYSELMKVSANGSIGGYLFSQNNRNAEPSGKLRTDWDCATLNMAEYAYTFTGRKYHHSEESQQYDLRQTSAAGTQTIETAVAGTYIVCTQEDACFLKVQENGWGVYNTQGDTLAEFDGDLYQDYSIVSDFALKKDTGAAFYLQTGKALGAAKLFKKIYSLQTCAQKLVILGKEENKEGLDYKVQKLIVADQTQKKAHVYYANDVADENSPLLLCSEGILTQKSGKSVFISYEKLETLPSSVVE